MANQNVRQAASRPVLTQNGTDGRVYGGDCNLIHVADGKRAELGAAMAYTLENQMRKDAFARGDRTLMDAANQPLCPGCYMVVGFDMLVTLARQNGQSLQELGRTMARAFDNLAFCDEGDTAYIESIHVILDGD